MDSSRLLFMPHAQIGACAPRHGIAYGDLCQLSIYAVLGEKELDRRSIDETALHSSEFSASSLVLEAHRDSSELQRAYAAGRSWEPPPNHQTATISACR